jgi:tetrahydromethanopterin S-methyltransferase subunit B
MELVSVAENLNSSAKDLLTPSSTLLATEPSRATVYASLRVLTEREKRERFLNMMVTAAMMLAFKNAFVGFLAGGFFWALLRLQDRVEDLGDARVGYAPLNEASALLRR